MYHLKTFPNNERTIDLDAGWIILLLVNLNFYCCELDKECLKYLNSKSDHIESESAFDKLSYVDNLFDNLLTHDYFWKRLDAT